MLSVLPGTESATPDTSGAHPASAPKRRKARAKREPVVHTIADYRAALIEASVALSSFRWRLNAAGFPFREPPDLARLMERIQTLCADA
jgi:hypothetical protein